MLSHLAYSSIWYADRGNKEWSRNNERRNERKNSNQHSNEVLYATEVFDKETDARCDPAWTEWKKSRTDQCQSVHIIVAWFHAKSTYLSFHNNRSLRAIRKWLKIALPHVSLLRSKFRKATLWFQPKVFWAQVSTNLWIRWRAIHSTNWKDRNWRESQNCQSSAQNQHQS